MSIEISKRKTSADDLEAELHQRIAELEAELAGLKQMNVDMTRGYKETFDLADVGIAHVSPDGFFLDANARLCEMLGRTSEELQGMDFRSVTYPEDIDTNLDLLESFRRNEIPGYRMQKRYVRSDGYVFWADLTVSAQVRAEGRPLRLISVIVDISQLKAVEERQAYLMGELNHRTKNLVALLQAIVMQTSTGAASVADLKATLLDRLTGMAASQDSLVSGSGHMATLGELVAGQMAVIVSSDDARVTVAGPEINVGPEAARAIGMALHELATNACKYGALSTLNGRVTIAWKISAPSGELLLSWIERDGPEVVPPTRTGFGRRVIERMAMAATGGTVELRFDPEGVQWSLRAPLGRLGAGGEF
jgi:PAS domain S-box-containing protein